MNKLFTIALALKLVENTIPKGLTETINKMDALGKATQRVGRGMNARLDAMGKKAGETAARLKVATDKMQSAAIGFGVSGVGAMAAVNAPLKAFEDLEDASVRMRLAYANAQGQTDGYFSSILRQTVELGNALPGTTKDFTALATALKEAGISEKAIGSGGLKAAGYLRTIFAENDSKKVAGVVAGSLHAFNLKDDSLLKYIDIMQRAHYAFGMTLDDFKYGLPYISRSYGLLNPKGGLDAARNQTAMMGILKQAGMEGSMIGESIGSFYTQLATRGSRMEFGLGRRGLMSKAGDILKRYHADLTVFDKKGGYVGDEVLVKQIWRLKELGATAQEIAIIGNTLAGNTGATIFTKLYQQGPEGWRQANERLDNQMDLYKKTGILLKTMKNAKEAAMGTITNLGAVIGGALAPDVKEKLDTLNNVTGRLQLFFEKQSQGNTVIWNLTKFALKAIAGLGGLALAFSAVAWTGVGLSKGLRVLMLLWQGLTKAVLFFRATQTVGMFGEIIKGASPAALWLGRLTGVVRAYTLAIWGASRAAAVWVWSRLVAGISGFWSVMVTATRAAWAFNAALLANPLTWLVVAVVAAVAGVGAALYQLKKHWSTLAGPGFWKDLKGWILDETMFGAFVKAGANIMNSLWQGMKSMAMKPVELIKSVVQKIRNFLPFSPAKEGPLRDIHRVRIMETIADSMKPAPMINAMRAATAATMIAVTPVSSLARSATSSASGSGMAITFAPQITIQGGNADQVKGQVNEALRISFTEFERMMKQYEQQKTRKAF